jgi:hypothetical protein
MSTLIELSTNCRFWDGRVAFEQAVTGLIAILFRGFSGPARKMHCSD